MATNVILPALGMAQETGKIVRWLKTEGEQVMRGEPLAEIETDKATVEIEAQTDGILTHISATAGDDVPVGQIIAVILSPEEASTVQQDTQRHVQNASEAPASAPELDLSPAAAQSLQKRFAVPSLVEGTSQSPIVASPLAARMAAEHNLDLSQVKPAGRRIQKADVLTYLQEQAASTPAATKTTARLIMASPKARRLASEQGKDIATIKGSGPGGAVLAADVLHAPDQTPLAPVDVTQTMPAEKAAAMTNGSHDLTVSTIWRIMAERTTQSWTSVPHFYLMREVNASRLIAWREHILKRSSEKVTYTDLLVKVVAAALHMHPRINASWSEGKITLKQAIHVGLAVAVEDGLVVPVIHHADTLGLAAIAQQRRELLTKAQNGKLRLQDISDGTFTISNLGMYNVDAFNAIINQPQAAILAVGRITERVVPINSQPAVQPMMILTLTCDHRVIDGAHGARFLATLADFIEEPLILLH
ncbi:MAG TPA: dihydrolipoamide acetyltransferase family protein [Ktedonobacteraceae bacterium]|nr:dihydrolipoamide acetyltransferase family protein [Ktedonobacteraceae bacterium]